MDLRAKRKEWGWDLIQHFAIIELKKNGGIKSLLSLPSCVLVLDLAVSLMQSFGFIFRPYDNDSLGAVHQPTITYPASHANVPPFYSPRITNEFGG